MFSVFSSCMQIIYVVFKLNYVHALSECFVIYYSGISKFLLGCRSENQLVCFISYQHVIHTTDYSVLFFLKGYK